MRTTPVKTPQVDAYIENAQPFAKPILKKIRSIFHKACPALEEKIKWGVPSFEYKGMLGGMAAFKRHVTWGLWKSALLDDKHGILHSDASSAMGAGKPTTLSELPPSDQIMDLIKQAMVLNDTGAKLPKRSGKRRPPLPTPADLSSALNRNAAAKKIWKNFSPSHQREYIEWIIEAKREETRETRLLQTIEWLSEGKSRNWKYEKF